MYIHTSRNGYGEAASCHSETTPGARVLIKIRILYRRLLDLEEKKRTENRDIL